MSMSNDIPQVPYNTNLEQVKQELFDNLYFRLGGDIVDIEIDQNHYESALNYAVKMYRQRSPAANQESYTLMTTVKGMNTYTLPSEFVSVRTIFRRTFGFGAGGGSGGSFEPFSQAAINTYLLSYRNSGGLATYDFWTQYVQLTARMFGAHITYTFDPVTKILQLDRNITHTGEKILIWGYTQRPLEILLQDPYVGVWIGDYTLAVLKGMIGEAREKFASITGPNGGTSLNGSQMKAESKAEMERLIDDLRKYQDGSMPLSVIIG